MRWKICLTLVCLLACGGCRSRQAASQERTETVVTISTASTAVRDVSFYSAALDRQMRYRVLLPARYGLRQDHRYPTLYLLHGHPGSFSDWTTQSRLLEYLKDAELIVILPQGDDSYYVNAARDPAARYEDYLVHDLVHDVDSHYATAPVREARGIGGLSIGGYGAFTLLVKHSDVWSFAAVMSGSLEVTDRKPGYDSWHNWWARRKTLGPVGSAACTQNDSFHVLAVNAPTLKKSHVMLVCGASDRLADVNRRIAAALADRGIEHEYVEKPGDHKWEYWDGVLPDVIAAAKARLRPLAERIR